MNSTWIRASCVMSGILLLATTATAQMPKDKQSSADTSQPTLAVAENRVSLEVARDQAKLMHNIYAATLEVMHDRYFHADRAIVPARAMEDVFSEIQRQSNVEARWIAVSFKPMSVDHEAESDFEKRAAKEIAAGKSEIDTVEDGFYRRAGAIPLRSNCISCHNGFFRTAPKKPRFAGLVISVPIGPDPDPDPDPAPPQ